MFNNSIHYTDLSAEDQSWMSANGYEKKFVANEHIIYQGQKISELYFVLSGLFSLQFQNKDLMTFGPGDIIGAMSVFSDDEAPASIIALESNCTAFVISHDKLIQHQHEDNNFAQRFYKMIGLALSNRITKLFTAFVARPKLINLGPPLLNGPVSLFRHDYPNFDLIKELLTTMPPISSLFKKMEEGMIDPTLLLKREQQLSVASLSAKSLQTLLEVANGEGVHELNKRIILHPPSLTAEEKQSLLPNYEIQKTVTLLIENKFVLCSSIGDFKLQHSLIHKIAAMLDLSHFNVTTYINPLAFIPEIELGLLRGMVSTFFSPDRITQLSLVILILYKKIDKDIAISLSPFESLILPKDSFANIVKAYAKRCYPYLPFAILYIDE